MKWRLTQTCALNAPFILVSVEIEDPATGETRTVRRGEEQYSCLVEPGSIVDVGDDVIPGPYWEPVDAAGEAMLQKYLSNARPDFHNTVENLSLSAVPGPAVPDTQSWVRENNGRPNADTPVHTPAVMQAMKAAQRPPRLPTLGRPK